MRRELKRRCEERRIDWKEKMKEKGGRKAFCFVLKVKHRNLSKNK